MRARVRIAQIQWSGTERRWLAAPPGKGLTSEVLGTHRASEVGCVRVLSLSVLSLAPSFPRCPHSFLALTRQAVGHVVLTRRGAGQRRKDRWWPEHARSGTYRQTMERVIYTVSLSLSPKERASRRAEGS